MAHIFSITDGTTTVTLTQTNGYIPTVYEMDTLDNKDEADPQFTETIEMLLLAASGPALQVLIHAVETLLRAARRRQLVKTAPRIYLQRQISGDSVTTRAEIIDARFQPSKDTLESWSGNKTPYHLIVTHRLWEGPRVEIPLASATSTTPAIGGKPITNGVNNWVQFADIDGVMDSPIELQLTNTSGSDIGYRNFYLATNAYSDPANFTPMLQGESRRSGVGTVTSDANSSGGSYVGYSFTNTGAIQWDLSTALLSRSQGRPFRLLARFTGASGTNIYVQPILRDQFGALAFMYGDEQLLPTNALVDLGKLNLPNGGYQPSTGPAVLELAFRATGAAQVNIDYIQLTPLDSYQYIIQRGYSIPNGGNVVFDNIEQVFSTGGQNIFIPRSGPIRAAVDAPIQRLYILYDEGSASNVARTMTVRAYARERRLSA